jgi:TetR/AcrR family transcriptional repressor of nem operon
VRVLVQRYRAAAAHGLASLDAGIADPLARLQAYTAWWSACIGNASQPLCVCAMLGAELPALPAGAEAPHAAAGGLSGVIEDSLKPVVATFMVDGAAEP